MAMAELTNVTRICRSGEVTGLAKSGENMICVADENQLMPDYGAAPRIISLDDGGQLFCLKSQKDEIRLTRYSVFPGVILIYNDIHAREFCVPCLDQRQNLLEIDHCRDGRMELKLGQEQFHLAPGDIAIHRLGNTSRSECFPTGHFHGITIQIDLDNCPALLSDFLDDANSDPKAICAKFLSENKGYHVLRQMSAIEHIFSELYNLPASLKYGYFKVKFMELLLFLSSLECVHDAAEQRGISEHQAALAKNICSYLTEHMEQKITLAELSEQFGVSASNIRNSFSGVYGVSIHAYMRGQRMHEAAKLLRTTDRTVLDIAGQFGYDNASKFAGVFRSIMGVTPTQYRKSKQQSE